MQKTAQVWRRLVIAASSSTMHLAPPVQNIQTAKTETKREDAMGATNRVDRKKTSDSINKLENTLALALRASICRSSKHDTNRHLQYDKSKHTAQTDWCTPGLMPSGSVQGARASRSRKGSYEDGNRFSACGGSRRQETGITERIRTLHNMSSELLRSTGNGHGTSCPRYDAELYGNSRFGIGGEEPNGGFLLWFDNSTGTMNSTASTTEHDAGTDARANAT